MRVVEMEAHEKGCWVEKKQQWTNLAIIQEMIEKINLKETASDNHNHPGQLFMFGCHAWVYLQGAIHSDDHRNRTKSKACSPQI